VASQVNGDRAMTASRQSHAHAVSQPGAGREAMDEHETNVVLPTMANRVQTHDRIVTHN
jgi:hypothetical protein